MILFSSPSPVTPQNLPAEATFWVEFGYTSAIPAVSPCWRNSCPLPELLTQLLVPGVVWECSQRPPGCCYLLPGGRKERRSRSSACCGVLEGGRRVPRTC